MSSDNPGSTLFGQYVIQELIGTGGMGAVYRADQPGLKRKVAIKVLNSSATAQPDYAERFAREAQTAAGLEHPHIVPVYDHGTTADGISYVVMRLLTGGSLGQRLERHKTEETPLPTMAETASLLRQMANALDYAHSKNVIHRDIKPNNIMFDDQSNAYLVDFGIARVVQDAGPGTLTQTGMVVGTPAYMPPEIWRGEGWSAAADQYALGIVIYEMISGRPPFESPTLYQLINMHLHEPVPPPQNWREDVPLSVTPVLERALAKTPEERYPTLTAFADDFDAAVQESIAAAPNSNSGFFTIPILPDGAVTRTFTSTPRSLLPPALTGSAPISAPPPRRSGLLLGVGAVLLLLVVGIGLFALQQRTANSNLQGTLTSIKATQAADAMVPEPDMMTATAVACAAGVTLSTDGGKGEIAFHSDRDGNKNIYLMNADGSNVRQLTDDLADDMNPVWSRDGNSMVFISTRDGNNRIYVMESSAGDRNTFTTRLLTDNQGDNGEPMWSPDGKQIVFASRVKNNWDVYVINADGSNVRQLTDHEANDLSPAWSPDGKQIAFISEREGNGELYVMNADGTNVQRLTRSAGNKRGDVRWSPDGKRIAVVSIEADNNWEVLTVDVSSNNTVTDVTNKRGAEWQPSWSPDGSLLSFLWQRDNVDILLMSADGQNQRNISSNPGDDYTHTWSVDGKRLAFETDRDGNWEIYSVNICGGDVRRLTNNSADDLYPAWRPGS